MCVWSLKSEGFDCFARKGTTDGWWSPCHRTKHGDSSGRTIEDLIIAEEWKVERRSEQNKSRPVSVQTENTRKKDFISHATWIQMAVCQAKPLWRISFSSVPNYPWILRSMMLAAIARWSSERWPGLVRTHRNRANQVPDWASKYLDINGSSSDDDHGRRASRPTEFSCDTQMLGLHRIHWFSRRFVMNRMIRVVQLGVMKGLSMFLYWIESKVTKAWLI